MLELQALYPLSHCSSLYNFASGSHITQRLSPLALAHLSYLLPFVPIIAYARTVVIFPAESYATVLQTVFHCPLVCGWLEWFLPVDAMTCTSVNLDGEVPETHFEWIWGTHGHCIFDFPRSPRINLSKRKSKEKFNV